jgi:hypothetical protein
MRERWPVEYAPREDNEQPPYALLMLVNYYGQLVFENKVDVDVIAYEVLLMLVKRSSYIQ